MALPETTGLLDLPAARWRALGARFEELGLAAEYSKVAAIGGDLFEPAAGPLRRWHQRRRDADVSRALRMFCLDDPVTAAEAESALGEVTAAELLDVGLLVREGEGVVSPFRLRAHEGLFFFADHLRHGGEAVMGAGPLTGVLLAASQPAGRVERALDLGCGAGVVALALARSADAVVATDINPRALVLARANAALCGATNIDFREGDLFEPVRGERFDRVASQPPFFPTPPGAAGTTYSQGGRRGDELALRLLEDLPRHLAPGGRAVSIVEWPVFEGDPPLARVRKAVGARANVLSIEADGPDVDAFCIGDTAFSHPGFGRAYEHAVVAQREHMEGIGIQGLRATLTIVEPAADERDGWTGAFEVADLLGAGVDAALVESLVAAHALVHRGREALLEANVRLREGTAFAMDREPLLRVLFQRGGPHAEIRIDRAAHRILEMVDASPSVQAAAKRFAKESSGPRGASTARLCAAVEQALLAGILVVDRR